MTIPATDQTALGMSSYLADLSAGARELAAALSTAAQVEPELIRAIRIGVLPHLAVDAESDLWFSGLAATRGPQAIVLAPEATAILREDLLRRLAESGPSSPYWQIPLILAQVHANIDPALQLEEEIIWRGLTDPDGPEHATRLLEPILAAAMGEGQSVVVNWFAVAWERLPARVKATRVAWQLAQLTVALMPDADITPDPAPDALMLSDAASIVERLPDVSLGVRRDGAYLVLGEPDAPTVINVPDTDPRFLEITTTDRPRRQVSVPAGQAVRVQVGTGAITLMNARGAVFDLAGAPPVMAARRASPPMADRRLPPVMADRPWQRHAIEGLLDRQAARVAIYGLPGIGKTVLAAELARSVRANLVLDKVLWADLGQAADAVDVLRGWCQDLEAEVSAVTGAPEEQLAYLRDRLSAAVSGQYVLFVLDDVGSSEGDIEAASACLIDNENCRYLLTTISPATASRFQAAHDFSTFHLQELLEPEATAMLERYAGGKLSLAALSQADRERLLGLGGGLPLGLMVLGRFFGEGLDSGANLQSLFRTLDSAETLVQLDRRGSIDTILMTRWVELPPDQREALQTAAVFRDKPHAFEEAAWACILKARRASQEGPEEPEDLAQRLGASQAEVDIRARAEEDEDDEDLRHVITARERLEPLRKALVKTGLLEQPVTGEPSFTMHSIIAAFLRTIPGLDAGELKRVNGLAARYYRGWLAGYQETQPVASPYMAAYRFENRQWLGATMDLCYHLREAGSEDEAVVLLTTLFFDAFWWWGELVHYPLCDELLRMWQLAHLGAKASGCLKQLRKFNASYPAIDLNLVPPDDPRALPSGYQDGTQEADFRAVRDAVQSIRDLVLGGLVDDEAAELDRERLRMLTAIYLGEANRVTGQFEQAAADYQEVLDVLEEFGQGGNDSDDWIIPYVYSEVADLYVRAGDPAKALDACDEGVRAAVGDVEVLGLDLGHERSYTDHEVLGRFWLAAGDAHWKAGRLFAAWRSYAWACFHACTCQLWPERVVLYRRPDAPPEWTKEFGIDDYTVTYYKLQLARLLDRLGELWTAGRQTEACEGVRIIRETLAGGPDRSSTDPGASGLLEVATLRPEAAWEDCRDLAWQDTGLAGLALPLIPWERLAGADGHVDQARVADQRRAAQDLAARLKDIWASNKWMLDNGPGRP